jgi:hypothetical protein
MTTTPRDDNEKVKRRALRLVTHAATKATKAEDERAAAWRYAAAHGASTREIADADGDVSHMTVQRTISRLPGPGLQAGDPKHLG